MVEQYNCPSYHDGEKIVDCVCGKCAKPKKRLTKQNKTEDYEREWASILLNDKKKALEVPVTLNAVNFKWKFTNSKKKAVCKYSAFDEYSDEEYVWQKGFDAGTVSGYESAQSDFKRVNKITWVLTAVNVGILLTLIIK